MSSLQTLATFLDVESSSLPEGPGASQVHGARSAEEHDAATGQKALGRQCGMEFSYLAFFLARSPRNPEQPLQPIHSSPCNATTPCQWVNYCTNDRYHARCLAPRYLLRVYHRYGERELVRDVSSRLNSDKDDLSLVAFFGRIGMKQPKKFAQDLKSYQCTDIDTLFNKGPNIWNMKMRVHSGVAKQLENGLRHYREGTLFWHYNLPRCDPLQAVLPEDCNLLASESDEGWWLLGTFGESEPAASANLPCNASVTLHDRHTRRAECLQEGARIASYNLRTGRASVSTVRSIARSTCRNAFFGATPATLIVHLRSRTMDCYQLRVAPTQLLWCVDGSEGMWAAAGSQKVQLPGGQFAKQVDLGNVLVRRGGEACVVVRIERDSDELVRLGMAGPRTLFIDGFLARSSGH